MTVIPMPVATAAGPAARTPPSDEEAEQAVLGACLLDQGALALALRLLRPEMFYRQAHARIFGAMSRLFPRAVDLVTVREELQRAGDLDDVGGVTYLTELMQVVPTAAHLQRYAEIVRDRYVERQLLGVAARVQALARDGDVPALEKPARAAAMMHGIDVGDQAGAVDHREVVADLAEELLRPQPGASISAGVPTGYVDLDELTGGGLFAPEVTYLAAPPKEGKTALALNIAENVAKRDGVVLFCSLEMSERQLAARRLCAEAHVSSIRLRARQLSDAERTRLASAMSTLLTRKIFVAHRSRAPVQWLAEGLRLRALHDRLDLVVVDYVQLAQPPGRWEKDHARVAAASQQLTWMARELNVPVLALSQMSREGRRRGTPEIDALRDSGQLEQDASNVWFLTRKSDDPDSLARRLIVKASRDGRTGSVDLVFMGEWMRFENAARQQQTDGIR